MRPVNARSVIARTASGHVVEEDPLLVHRARCAIRRRRDAECRVEQAAA